jgi:hypothetical protein
MEPMMVSLSGPRRSRLGWLLLGALILIVLPVIGLECVLFARGYPSVELVHAVLDEEPMLDCANSPVLSAR